MLKITLSIILFAILGIFSCTKTPTSSSNIEYPKTGGYGLNLLDFTTFSYNSGNYTFKANVPGNKSLRVKVSGKASWFYDIGKIGNWYYTDYNSAENSREFFTNHNTVYEMEIGIFNPQVDNRDSLKFEIFENGSTIPTRVKKIKVN
jgi:hypothetical protein